MDLCNLQDIRTLLKRHGFAFSKSMGQNFLIDSSIPRRIVEQSGIGISNGVLEIGPGVGCLTQYLSSAAGHVVAVELDRHLIPILQETVGGLSNVDIINGDIMKADIEAITSSFFHGLEPVICANLPYNITTPVLTKLIDSKLFSSITVMVQREVARRMYAAPGSDDYGAFSVYISFYTEPSLLFDVPPYCFEPRPKVTSSVITLKRRNIPAADCDEALFFKIVRGAFGQRRKTLQNALTSAFSANFTKDDVSKIINESGLSPSVRGETLGISEFEKLTTVFGKKL